MSYFQGRQYSLSLQPPPGRIEDVCIGPIRVIEARCVNEDDTVEIWSPDRCNLGCANLKCVTHNDGGPSRHFDKLSDLAYITGTKMHAID